MHPTVLTIAGSDSSGGAGIQADLKSIAANGGYGASVLTALTAQNTQGVQAAEPVSLSMIDAQLEAVFSDLDVISVKTGMLANDEVVDRVAEALERHQPKFYVCDPVMVSKTGHALLPPESVQALISRLLPLATVVTPNVHEARALSGLELTSAGQAEEVGRALLDKGARAVLIKGGHLDDQLAVDILVSPDGVERFESERLDAKHTHGTGCTYSAAIATHLAGGLSLTNAIGISKQFMTEAIRGGLAVGHGIGPTDPFFFLGEKTGWLDGLVGP